MPLVLGNVCTIRVTMQCLFPFFAFLLFLFVQTELFASNIDQTETDSKYNDKNYKDWFTCHSFPPFLLFVQPFHTQFEQAVNVEFCAIPHPWKFFLVIRDKQTVDATFQHVILVIHPLDVKCPVLFHFPSPFGSVIE